jgi:mono/diheme cytochrome c family protein
MGRLGNAFRWLLASRLRVVLIALGLLASLDIGRSIYARIGYARPVEHWEPDPRVYADLAWPPGSDLPPEAPLGARVYAQHCAVCHGPNGRGNGPAAPSMIPHPTDFTLGQFKHKSTPPGEPPSDADLTNTVAQGLGASAMPYWSDLLNRDEILAVVAYIKDFSPVFERLPSGTLIVPPRLSPGEQSIARGRKAYTERNCAACHGADGRGGPTLQDAKDYPVDPRDLTAPWTFRGGSAPEQLWRRITIGMPPGPMPPLPAEATPEERWDIVNYVESIARKPPWETGGRLDGPGFNPDLMRRGQYLVHAEICGLCHTMIDRTGIYRDDRYLAGGMRVGVYPHGMLVSPNLTSDAETGLGRWSEAQVVAALRNGRSKGGRVLTVFGMVWVYFHGLTDDDGTAIVRYLKTLPPVHNRIPPPLRYGVIETVAAKLTGPLPQAPAAQLTYADQGFGFPDGTGFDVQRVLIDAQWIVLGLGLAGFVFAGPRERRFPSTARSWTGVTIGTTVLGVLGAAVWALDDWPQLTFIPPQEIVAGATAGIFNPARSTLGGDSHAAMVDRGRYLFTVGSCALCHTNDGSGGLKVSWKPFGTLWSRNLTSDRDTGVGAWTDAQIARAIRSGVSRNGHALHWQGMTWDHASNWDEEDIRSLVAYLRVLPPVKRDIPTDRPPGPDDCAIYTFWTTASRGPGCGP